jgi:type II restriction enzyme
MNLSLKTIIPNKYKSQSQKIRILSEFWVGSNIYCPNCGKINLTQYGNNKPVADFYCKNCSEDFELKSKKGKISKKISAGAYAKMIERINSKQKPNFFLMDYLETLLVSNFFIIPKHFFVPSVIEKRNPLSDNARRAGWIGSNILFHKIPKVGHIFYIKNGKEMSKEKVLENWQKTVFLKKMKNIEAKGWILDIMNCIESLNKKEFSLSEIYQFEPSLKIIHPKNKHIKDKIRQQLQILRDKEYLLFINSGRYKLL